MKKLFIISLSILVLISCNKKTENKETISSTEIPQTKIKTDLEQDTTGFSEKTYSIENISIKVKQKKGDGKNFYCKSELLVFKENKLINSLKFKPEPVGGEYGISKPKKYKNHLIFTKHGDYDERTIIINNKGEVFNIIGSSIYFSAKNELLFSIYQLGGFSVFDLSKDSLIFEQKELEDEPLSVHKAFGDRYFLLCYNDNPEEIKKIIWEIEFDINRIMEVDLDTTQINKSNVLETWEFGEVNCECEK